MENSDRYSPYAGTVLVPKTDKKQPLKSKETVKWSRKKKIIINILIAVAVTAVIPFGVYGSLSMIYNGNVRVVSVQEVIEPNQGRYLEIVLRVTGGKVKLKEICLVLVDREKIASHTEVNLVLEENEVVVQQVTIPNEMTVKAVQIQITLFLKKIVYMYSF
ncbi:MAG: hypothetical protein HZR80_02685 [Candidatus Heimdallarchaeota archaeon]